MKTPINSAVCSRPNYHLLVVSPTACDLGSHDNAANSFAMLVGIAATQDEDGAQR